MRLGLYPPLPGLLTDDPELPLPDDELPLPEDEPLLPEDEPLLLLFDEGEYVLVFLFDEEEELLLLGKIISLPACRVLLLLLLLYCVDGFDQVTVPVVLPVAILLL